VSFKELLDSWRESAAAPRTVRSYAVHLAIDDAAQLAALAEMFPGRAPEQLISELLGQALKAVAAAMPYVPGQRVISTDEQGDPVYEDVGPTPRFIQLTRDYRRSLEGSSVPTPTNAANDAAAAPRSRAPVKSPSKSRSKSRSKSGGSPARKAGKPPRRTR
jgi:hypothetical protein